MTPHNETLQEALRALPPLEPPADGWPRLQRTLPATMRRRLAAGLALAASVVLVVSVALRLPSTPAPTAEEREVAALMQQSRTLEQDLAQLRPQVAVWNADYEAATRAIEGRLAVVDVQLNYAAPASARRLWQDRVALLGSLVETHEAASLNLAAPATFNPDPPQPDSRTEWSL